MSVFLNESDERKLIQTKIGLIKGETIGIHD